MWLVKRKELLHEECGKVNEDQHHKLDVIVVIGYNQMDCIYPLYAIMTVKKIFLKIVYVFLLIGLLFSSIFFFGFESAKEITNYPIVVGALLLLIGAILISQKETLIPTKR